MPHLFQQKLTFGCSEVLPIMETKKSGKNKTPASIQWAVATSHKRPGMQQSSPSDNRLTLVVTKSKDITR